MSKTPPQIKNTQIFYNDKCFNIEYFIRLGQKETILFVHGLGGAKEDYWKACKSNSLKDHTLISFDHPGTGNSTYYNDHTLDIDDLTAITSLFIDNLKITNFILVGTSMGGLTTLLYLLRGGASKVKAYVNIEGNLMPEDCMFSGKIVLHDYDTFANEVFPKFVEDMKKNGNTGYHITATNLELNTNVKAYHNYSFQTVKYSATGELLRQYIALDIPRIFIFGDENADLSYIPELIKNNMIVKSISNSNHFIYYDNPKEIFDVIGEFINNLK